MTFSNINAPLLLDGAMGTHLMKNGMKTGECPEAYILRSAENTLFTEKLQRAYIDAGSKVIYTPTFGANPKCLRRYGLDARTEEINEKLAGVSMAARGSEDAVIAGDISSAGFFMAPYGDDSFETVYDNFARQLKALDSAGVDLFVIETQISLSEARTALLAVKEQTAKKVMVTMTLDGMKTMSGNDILACFVSLYAAGADAFGINCSSGPEMMKQPVEAIMKLTPRGFPIIAKPNLPRDGSNASLEGFAKGITELVTAGADFVGGCCQTTPAHIKSAAEALRGMKTVEKSGDLSKVCSSEREIFTLDGTENIACEFLCDRELADNISDAEPEDGIISVKLNSPEDAANLCEASAYISLPLMLEGNYDALSAAMRAYPGRVILNSESKISADERAMLIKQYSPVML